MNEDTRRSILAELMAAMPKQHTMEAWQFTVADFAAARDWRRPRAERYLRQQVAEGKLRMDLDGYDPRTGRRAALYWRPEDEDTNHD